MKTRNYNIYNVKSPWRIMAIMVISISLSMVTACNKLLEEDSSHIVNESNQWKTIADARNSLMGIYGLLRAAVAENNAYWLYGELRSGDFTALSRRDLQVIIDGDLRSSYTLVEQASNWRKFYAVVNAANLFIERSPEVKALDKQYTDLNNQVDIAQARAMKGFVYFLMARIWGDVPIWQYSNDGAFPRIAKSSESEVLAYAKQELIAAAQVLPFRYGSLTDEVMPVEQYYGYDLNRWSGVLLNRNSVNAILAHISAWQGQYLDASVYADYVLANAVKAGNLYVDADFLSKGDGFFFNSNASQIIGIPFSWGYSESSFDGHIEQLTLSSPLVPRSLPDIFVPADNVVKIFDQAGDPRFNIDNEGKVTTSYFTDFNGTRPIFSKIKVIRDGLTTDGSFPLFSSAIVFTRLEEIALLKAEASAALGNTALALSTLNTLRKRRNLAEVSSSADVIDEIFAERRRELMGEGWRWYDLIRYHKLKLDDLKFSQLIADKGIYWPIAQEVLNNNSLLEQNPYWK